VYSPAVGPLKFGPVKPTLTPLELKMVTEPDVSAAVVARFVSFPLILAPFSSVKLAVTFDEESDAKVIPVPDEVLHVPPMHVTLL